MLAEALKKLDADREHLVAMRDAWRDQQRALGCDGNNLLGWRDRKTGSFVSAATFLIGDLMADDWKIIKLPEKGNV